MIISLEKKRNSQIYGKRTDQVNAEGSARGRRRACNQTMYLQSQVDTVGLCIYIAGQENPFNGFFEDADRYMMRYLVIILVPESYSRFFYK